MSCCTIRCVDEYGVAISVCLHTSKDTFLQWCRHADCVSQGGGNGPSAPTPPFPNFNHYPLLLFSATGHLKLSVIEEASVLVVHSKFSDRKP